MKRDRANESWWLTRDQRQLLFAIFGDDRIASRAWNEWIREASIETMEPASMLLAPLLCRRSSFRTSEAPEVKPFKGVYRRTWYHNHLVLRDLVFVLARLRAAGIRTILPPDLSMLVVAYNDIGLRPLDGMGVLVDPEQAEAAAGVLLESGWKHRLPCTIERARRERTWIRFYDAAGKHFDLRWHLGAEPFASADRDATWTKAVPVSILGEDTLALSTTDQLLATNQVGCWHPVPSGRWVADALTVLLRAESTMEWDRVIAFSRQSRISLWIHSRLSYLRDEWRVVIPHEVFDAIDRVPKSVIDRMEYAVRRSSLPTSTDSMIYRAGRRIRCWQNEHRHARAQ